MLIEVVEQEMNMEKGIFERKNIVYFVLASFSCLVIGVKHSRLKLILDFAIVTNYLKT